MPAEYILISALVTVVLFVASFVVATANAMVGLQSRDSMALFGVSNGFKVIGR